MKLRLLAYAAALAAAPVSASAQGEAVRATAISLLSHCLANPDGPFPADARIVPAPPGLARDDRIVVARTPAGEDRLFVYRGGGAALTCGIALYRRVDAHTQAALVALLDRQPGWRRGEPGRRPWLASLPVRRAGGSMRARPACRER